MIFVMKRKGRKRAETQRQQWDMQWVTGLAPGSPFLSCLSHRVGRASGTCHTDSYLTHTRPGLSVKTETSTAKEQRRGKGTHCLRLSSLPQEADRGFTAKTSRSCDNVFTPLKTLDILFGCTVCHQGWTKPKIAAATFRHIKASCSSF